MNTLLLTPMEGAIDLSGGFDSFWKAIISATGPGFPKLLNILAVAFMCAALGMWLYKKRKGTGGDSSAVMWTAVFAAALAAPTIVFPIALNFIDWALNAAAGFLPNK